MIRFLLCLTLLTLSSAHAQELRLRHKLDGAAVNALGALAVKFNDEQRGKGRIRLEFLPSPGDRRQLPHLALLDRADSREYFETLPRFLPLHQLMKTAKEPLDTRSLFPQVADAVDDGAGRLQALPLALGLPVLYLNRAKLRAAGVDPAQVPRTWWELQGVAGKLFASGVECPLTSSDFAWVHIENLASQHDQPLATRNRTAERVALNSLINVKHIALLASWQKSQYFHYSGAGRDGDRRFLRGECAMLTGDSALYAEALRIGLEVDIHALPHYDDVYGVQPGNVLPDGASLWALAGLKTEEVKLAAKFVRFLLRPEVQRQWVSATTFLPMTPAAITALRQAQVFPPSLLDAAQRRLAMPNKDSTRPRSGPALEQLRAIVGEEIEPIWQGNRPAKEALDLAVQRANALNAPVIKPR